MSREERVCLGAVVGVHGIRGEVKVKSFTEIDRDLGKYGDLENEDASRRFTQCFRYTFTYMQICTAS